MSFEQAPVVVSSDGLVLASVSTARSCQRPQPLDFVEKQASFSLVLSPS